MAVSSDINKTYVGENVVSTGFGKTWKGNFWQFFYIKKIRLQIIV